MLQIRKFAEERKAWESEREELEERSLKLTNEKDEAVQRLAKLTEEVERLRSRGPGEEAACPDPALQARIDSLKSDLEQEESKSRDFEKRASEAELANQRLTADLDRLRESTMRAPFELDCTRELTGGAVRDSLMSERPTTTTIGRPTCDPSVDELLATRRSLDAKTEELRTLEEESVKLRTELNGEKQKVIDLKAAAHNRGAAWKEELAKITDELASTQRLEEEVAKLRLERQSYDNNLAVVQERETEARKEIEKMQAEIFQARQARKRAQHKFTEKAEEMEALSSTVGGQLVAVEEELTKQVQQTSHLLELFLQHTLSPLTILRRSCKRIAAQGPSGNDHPPTAPPLHNADVNDLQNNLVKMVNILRYASDILDARDQIQSQKGGKDVISRIDELNETAKGWLQTVMGQPPNKGDCC
jgi:chromosome segregation ATPase